MDSSVLAILAIDCNIWISTEKSISIIDPRVN